MPPDELRAPTLIAPAMPEFAWAGAVRHVFSFPVFLSLALAVLTMLTVRQRFYDPDVWWHLKVGEIIWNTQSIPHADLFSFTTNQHAWTDHEWLYESFVYGCYTVAGNTGLMLYFGAGASLLFILVYVLCSLYSGNAKVSLLGGLIGWFFGTVSLGPRALILGYGFLVLELIVIQLGRTRGRRWFWALPPLFAVWVNWHGSYALGLGVLACLVICS